MTDGIAVVGIIVMMMNFLHSTGARNGVGGEGATHGAVPECVRLYRHG